MSSGGSVLVPSTSMKRVPEWKVDTDEVETKRQRLDFYFRLESESSMESGEDDTESVYSIQDKETDIARDTTDTDTVSCSEDTDIEVTVEYDVATESEDDEFPLRYSSSGTDNVCSFAAAEDAIAAVLCDSSMEAWITDVETSDNSSIGDFEVEVGFRRQRPVDWICVQCKSQKNNGTFRFCDKCFQVRKSLFPPRPKGKRKRNVEKKDTATVQNVKSGLKNLSRDSGSNQDIPKWDFNKIVKQMVSDIFEPPRKKSKSDRDVRDDISDNEHSDKASSMFSSEFNPASSKISDSGISIKASSINEDDKVSAVSSNNEDEVNRVIDKASDSGISASSISSNIKDNSRTKDDLCIMCNSNPKNGIFLHGSIGHMCSCYKCAMKSWRTSKRCPVCNCKVKNVVKLFTM